MYRSQTRLRIVFLLPTVPRDRSGDRRRTERLVLEKTHEFRKRVFDFTKFHRSITANKFWQRSLFTITFVPLSQNKPVKHQLLTLTSIINANFGLIDGTK